MATLQIINLDTSFAVVDTLDNLEDAGQRDMFEEAIIRVSIVLKYLIYPYFY